MKEDVKEQLKSPSVSDRAEALRQYERFGELDDIDLLLGFAQDDSSVAIRNHAADAISDILSRYRVGKEKEKLSLEARQDLLKKFRKVVVSKNSSVFLMYASLGIPQVFSIVSSGLFDPRSELRICSAIGLKCFCLSADMLGNQEIEGKVVSLLQNHRLDFDSIAHVARLCAEVGYVSALPILEEISGEGMVAETIQAAIEQLRKAKKRPIGIWRTKGLDAIEFNPELEEKNQDQVLIVSHQKAALVQAGEWTNIADFSEQQQRRLFFRKIGDPMPGEAFQIGKKTFFMASEKAIEDLEKDALNLDGEINPCLVALADVERRGAADSSKAWRNVALLYLLGGDLEQAQEACEVAKQLKRTPNDVWFIEGRIHRELGNEEEAQKCFQTCMEHSRSETSVLAKLCLSYLE